MSGQKIDITGTFQTWGGRGPVVNYGTTEMIKGVPAGYAKSIVVRAEEPTSVTGMPELVS